MQNELRLHVRCVGILGILGVKWDVLILLCEIQPKIGQQHETDMCISGGPRSTHWHTPSSDGTHITAIDSISPPLHASPLARAAATACATETANLPACARFLKRTVAACDAATDCRSCPCRLKTTVATY